MQQVLRSESFAGQGVKRVLEFVQQHADEGISFVTRSRRASPAPARLPSVDDRVRDWGLQVNKQLEEFRLRHGTFAALEDKLPDRVKDAKLGRALQPEPVVERRETGT